MVRDPIFWLRTYCELLTAASLVTPLAEETYRTADFGAYYRFVRSGFASAAPGRSDSRRGRSAAIPSFAAVQTLP
jgi:hypothetical protein